MKKSTILILALSGLSFRSAQAFTVSQETFQVLRAPICTTVDGLQLGSYHFFACLDVFDSGEAGFKSQKDVKLEEALVAICQNDFVDEPQACLFEVMAMFVHGRPQEGVPGSLEYPDLDRADLLKKISDDLQEGYNDYRPGKDEDREVLDPR